MGFSSMFNQQELQILLGGVNSPVDLDDLRKHTVYGGVYDDGELSITLFWNVSIVTTKFIVLTIPRVVVKVVNTFDHVQRRALLRFVTSCSRPPLL
jgi:ubiquitin-protein ligase E3 C